MFVQASKNGYFKAPYRWIMINEKSDLSVLENIDILVDSDVVVAQKIGDQEYVFLEGMTFYRTQRCCWLIHNTLVIEFIVAYSRIF